MSSCQLLYACVTLKHWTNAVDSHGALGFAGVLLVTVAVASGLGFCSFVNIKFNAASTQVSCGLSNDYIQMASNSSLSFHILLLLT